MFILGPEVRNIFRTFLSGSELSFSRTSIESYTVVWSIVLKFERIKGVRIVFLDVVLLVC